MKKIILSVALFSATLSFAQQKEIKQAFSALEGNDMATATSKIKEADAILGDKTYLLEPSLLEQYYLVKGIGLLKTGKTEEGAEILGKITDLGKSTIYRGKNANKEKVYFIGKEAADASGITKLKEKTYELAYKNKVATLVNPMLQSLSTNTINQYNDKKYAEAGDGFKKVYHLLKAVGQDDLQYLYNSAISYGYAKQNGKAIDVFNTLINKGYTGVQTTYSAKDKTTGKDVIVDKATWEALKKNPQYSDFKSSTSKSIEEGLYDSTIALLIEEEKYDQALTIVEKGLKKLPNSSKLLNQQGIVYARLGKTDEFINNLQTQLKSNPNDAIAWFNLGVLYGKSQKNDESVNAYKKAIAIDGTMKNAYLNLAFQLMGDDQKTISEYNSVVNKRGGEAKAKKILQERAERFQNALPYAEKLFELERNSQNANLLKSIYKAIKNKAKYKEFEKLEADLAK